MLNLPQTPKWDIARVSHSTLVNADCFDVFPFIEDKSIDAIICDLPYGTTACKWDSVLNLTLLWCQYFRVLKNGGNVVLFSQQPFTSELINSAKDIFRYEVIWEKEKPSNFAFAKHGIMKYHENILIFGEGNGTYNPQMTIGKPNHSVGKGIRKKNNESGANTAIVTNKTDGLKHPKSVMKFNREAKPEHPTQKPIELMEYIIKTYTNENDTVLDNTMGSGTTNLACIKLNRKSIGIEKEKQYYDVAVRRLSSYCG